MFHINAQTMPQKQRRRAYFWLMSLQWADAKVDIQ